MVVRLSKTQILAASDLKSEDVDVPEWGGTVTVREFTAADRDAFVAATTTVVNGKREAVVEGMNAKLCAMCIVDDAGVRIFSDEEIAELSKKSSVVIERLAGIAGRLNRLMADDVQNSAKN